MPRRGNSPCMGIADIDNYPLTGRFLLGRLRHAMSAAEKDLLESLVERTERVPGGRVLLRRGELTDQSTLVIEGYLLRAITEGGHRFVVGLHVPGDFADLHAFALKRLDHGLATVGEVTLGYVSHARLEQVVEDHPHLARLLWFATLLDAAIHREWILKLEQLPAPRRVAHIFAELWHRLDLVGPNHVHIARTEGEGHAGAGEGIQEGFAEVQRLGVGNADALARLARRDGLRTPLIQADLADMCGTTTIHMNRALGQLKKEGIAEFRRGTVYVSDRARLEEFAGFNPDYLYGQGELRVGGELNR